MGASSGYLIEVIWDEPSQFLNKRIALEWVIFFVNKDSEIYEEQIFLYFLGLRRNLSPNRSIPSSVSSVVNCGTTRMFLQEARQKNIIDLDRDEPETAASFILKSTEDELNG